MSITPLLVYRVIGDHRVPYIIELDEEMTVLSDSPVEDHPAPPPVEASPVGIEGVVREERLPNGGRKIFYKPTPLDIKVGTWVTPGVVENPIPGTDALRAEFFKAEDAMRAKAKADGTACADCDLGSLIRHYRAILGAAGHLDDFKAPA